jgi:hypothetical protein
VELLTFQGHQNRIDGNDKWQGRQSKVQARELGAHQSSHGFDEVVGLLCINGYK